MLVAIGVETSVAFTIMDDRNNDSWGWFMACSSEGDLTNRLVD